MDTSDDFLPLLHSPDSVFIKVWRSGKTVRLAQVVTVCSKRQKWSTRKLYCAILKSAWKPLKSSQRLLEVFNSDLRLGL